MAFCAKYLPLISGFALILGGNFVKSTTSTTNDLPGEIMNCALCALCPRNNITENYCKNCSCLSNTNSTYCGDLDIKSLHNGSGRGQLPGLCFKPQILEFTKPETESQLAFFMVSSCQISMNDTEIKSKCTNVSTTPLHVTDIKTYIPVTDKDTNITYRNYYCSLCNGVTQYNVITWEAKLSCVSDMDLDIENILPAVYKRQECNIFFIPPDRVKDRVCGGDRHMIWTNTSLVNKTVVSSLQPHGDVFCNRCQFTETSTFCGRNVSSFINEEQTSFHALLDMDVINADNSIVEDQHCRPQQIFDTQTATCKAEECTMGFKYINRTCRSIFKAEGMRSYDLFLNFRSLKSEHVCIYTLNHSILIEQVNHSLFTLISTNGLERFVYKLRIIFPPEEKCSKNHAFFPNHFFVHLFLFSNDIKKKEIIENALALDNMQIVFEMKNINESLQYNSSVDGRDFKSRGYLGMFYTDPGENSHLEVITEIKNFHFQFKYIDVRMTRVTKQQICPRIHLPSSELQVTNNTNEICMGRRNTCFSYDQYMPANGDGILVCSDYYLSKIDFVPVTTSNKSEFVCDRTLFDDENLKFFVVMMSTISIVCLTLTIFTYTVLPSLRTESGTITLVLCITQLIVKVLLLFVIPSYHNTACKVVGGLMHYFSLIPMLWMNVGLLNLNPVIALRQALTGFKPNRSLFFIRCSLFCFGTPLVFVFINVMVSLAKSNWTDFGYGRCICFVSDAELLGFTFVLPGVLILIINGALFLTVMENMRKLEESGKKYKLLSQEKKSVFVYLVLSCSSAITWMTAVLYGIMHYGSINYIFFVMSAAQDLFIFLMFACNRRVCSKYENCFRNNQNKTFIKIDK